MKTSDHSTAIYTRRKHNRRSRQSPAKLFLKNLLGLFFDNSEGRHYMYALSLILRDAERDEQNNIILTPEAFAAIASELEARSGDRSIIS
jgi:hypothetical protein